MSAVIEAPRGRIFARPKKVIALHWFNAVCWFVLTVSGLGIIRGDLRLMPAGFAEWMQNAVGGQFNLITGHSVLGLIWAAAFVIFSIANWNAVVYPFLRKILVLTPGAALSDLKEMAVSIAQLFGLMKDVNLPPAGRYNVAQRLLGTMIILSAALIAVTGTLMFALFLFTPIWIDGEVFQWSLVAHGFLVGLVYIGLVAHIYYALIEEPESLDSMVSGYLDEGYVKRHNPAWYAELKQQGKV